MSPAMIVAMTCSQNDTDCLPPMCMQRDAGDLPQFNTQSEHNTHLSDAAFWAVCGRPERASLDGAPGSGLLRYEGLEIARRVAVSLALVVLHAEDDEITGHNPELAEKVTHLTSSQCLHFLHPLVVPTTLAISDGVEFRIVFESQEFGVELLKLLNFRRGCFARPYSVQQEGHEEDHEGESPGGIAGHLDRKDRESG